MPTTPSPPGYPRVERRHRARGRMSRLLTAPIPSAAIESRLRRLASPLWRRGWPVLALAVIAGLVGLVWSSRVPVLTPQHRPEALCFALARAQFAPPMAVEPSAAVVRGRFGTQTPAAMAVREAMHLTDDMVIREEVQRAGDYAVSVLWLRLPGRSGHWLVMGWMEGADLAVCSFHFAGDEADVSHDERVWGERLLYLTLTPENFRAGALPPIRLRGEPPRSFGPKTKG